MDRDAELAYLFNLTLQASRWQRDPDETLSGLELEVQDRVRTLLGQDTRDENGFHVANPKQKKRPATETPVSTAPTDGKVKVQVAPGKYKRLPVFMVRQEPCRCSKTGFKWVVRDEYAAEAGAVPEEAPEVDKLGDELWNEHESGK